MMHAQRRTGRRGARRQGAQQVPRGALVNRGKSHTLGGGSRFKYARGGTRLSDLQQGRPLYITAPDAGGVPGALVAAVEGARRGTLGRLGRLTGQPVRLGVTAHRARAMGLSNGGRPLPLSLPLPAAAAPDDILRLATSPAASGVLGDVREASAPEAGGLALARLARLIPAVVAAPVGAAEPPALRRSLERAPSCTSRPRRSTWWRPARRWS